MPLFRCDLVDRCFQHAGHHLVCVACQALSLALSDAENDIHAVVERVLHLDTVVEVAFFKDLPLLGMANNGPRDADILQNFSIVGTNSAIVEIGSVDQRILRTDRHICVLELFGNHTGEDYRRCNDHIALGLLHLQVVGKLTEGLEIDFVTFHLPISTDKITSLHIQADRESPTFLIFDSLLGFLGQSHFTVIKSNFQTFELRKL